jgi:hypothetical protein
MVRRDLKVEVGGRKESLPLGELVSDVMVKCEFHPNFIEQINGAFGVCTEIPSRCC